MLEFRNYSFRYEGSKENIIENVSFSVKKGEVALLFGPSGSGKSTLLRSIKPMFSRNGHRKGEIIFDGKNVNDLTPFEMSKIGYISQDVENMIVTDKVWHELAFGLENLGLPNNEIRLRCGEMAAYFGIEKWFDKKTNLLSTGQKQLLNLASVMIMHPDILILDEPVSTLDPVASSEILDRVFKLNRDFGTTVLMVMHELEEVYNRVDKVIFLDGIAKEGSREDIAKFLIDNNNNQVKALPTSARLYSGILDYTDSKDEVTPLTVAEGKRFVEVNKDIFDRFYLTDNTNNKSGAGSAIRVKNIYFKYEKDADFILEDFSISIDKGEIYTLMGGNGSGKSTTLSLVSKLLKPMQGKVFIFDKDISKLRDDELYGTLLGVVPQEPRNLFFKDTVIDELRSDINMDDKGELLNYYIDFFGIKSILNVNPFDISGGEMQKVALIKVLLLNPQILILDEPTKGLDGSLKETLAFYLKDLKKKGITILIVSHDSEFAARVSDRVGFLFNKRIVSEGVPRQFFKNNHFYTTQASRITDGIYDDVVLVEDLLPRANDYDNDINIKNKENSFNNHGENLLNNKKNRFRELKNYLIIFICTYLFMLGISKTYANQNYFVFSILILGFSMLGLYLYFEKTHTSEKRIVIVASLTGLSVAGRVLFYMVPGFKPVAAMSIIAGFSLDPFSGFLCGSLSAFLSNAFFGQGSWTAFQMFGFGLLGLIGGILGILSRHGSRRVSITNEELCLVAFAGFFTTFAVYGFLMNFFTSLTAGKAIKETLLINIVSGIPLDLIHGLSTAVFILLIGRPLIKRVYRVKYKYDI